MAIFSSNHRSRKACTIANTNKKARRSFEPGLSEYGLAVTYFRVRKRHTIIGANPFHGPVRDGKAWFQAAVAAR
jgi:hypothetical protein